MRQEVIGLATKERAKLKAFEEILSQRSDLTRKAAAPAQESASTRTPADSIRTSSPAAPKQVVLEDTPEPAIKPELAQTPQQPTPRQVVLEFNVGDQSNWELACETARKSGAVLAKVVLSFRYIYMYAPWCQDMLTGGL